MAAQAFDACRQLPDERRAAFRKAIAYEIGDVGSALTERAHVETALPLAPRR